MDEAKRSRPIPAGRMLLLPLLAGLCLCACREAIPKREAPPAGREMESLALEPHRGGARLDSAIRREQARVASAPNPAAQAAAFAELGRLFLAKARESFDPAYAKRAEGCAALSLAAGGDTSEAWMIEAQALLHAHAFREAEAVARKLAARRGLPEDFGILGDALLELGRLDEAVEAYQKLLDMKPGFQAYARAAQVRRLRGDREGAEAALALALRAAGPRDGESAAWAWTQLAWHRFEAADFAAALAACEGALGRRPGYPPALHAKGRALLAQGDARNAAVSLSEAVAAHPLAEYRWALRDALAAAGSSRGAAVQDSLLRSEGATADSRGAALFLAAEGETSGRALQSARREAASRGDLHAFDALALSLHADGRPAEAWTAMERALAPGYRDARLHLHAGLIHLACGRPEAARRHLDSAAAARHQLLPSEWRQARKALSGMGPRKIRGPALAGT